MHGHVHNMPKLILRGTMQAVGMVTYYAAMYLLPLADTVVIGLLHPPMTALISRVILKEPMGWKGWLGCCLSLLGVVVLAHPPALTHFVDHVRGHTDEAAHCTQQLDLGLNGSSLHASPPPSTMTALNDSAPAWMLPTHFNDSTLQQPDPTHPLSITSNATEDVHSCGKLTGGVNSMRTLGVCLGLFSATMQACEYRCLVGSARKVSD